MSRRTLERIENGEVDFFSFDVHFAHVMAGGGFDIVASNPPWVRNGRIEPGMRRMIRERYRLFRAPAAGAAVHPPHLRVSYHQRSGGVSQIPLFPATKNSQKDVANVLNALVETIEKTVSKNKKVTLVGFGTFEARKRAARSGRNPQTGEPIKIPAKTVVKFRVAKAAISGLEGEAEPGRTP